MILQRETVHTRDGYQIEVRRYQPSGLPVKRVLVLGPGAGTDPALYQPFAEYCAASGYAVFCFNFRGTGAEVVRNTQATLLQWGTQDLDATLLHARKAFPGHELVFVGHCVSGEIAGIAPASEYIDRMVLVSSALSCWRLWPRSSQPLIWLLKLLQPLISAWYGYFPGNRLKFLGDMPIGVAREFSDWCNRPNGLFDVFPDNNYRKLNIPIMAISFSDDWFTPPRAVAALLSHFASAQIQWQHLDPASLGLGRVGHNGFFHLLSRPLWEMILDWIENPVQKPGYFF